MWLQLLINNWRVIAYGSAIVVLFGTGWHYGASSIQTKWDASIQDAKDKVRDIEHRDAQDTAKIGTDYENSRNDIDARYIGFINSLHSTRADLPETNSASGVACTPNGDTISEQDKRDFYTLAKEAETNTQKLINLQQKVKNILATNAE